MIIRYRVYIVLYCYPVAAGHTDQGKKSYKEEETAEMLHKLEIEVHSKSELCIDFVGLRRAAAAETSGMYLTAYLGAGILLNFSIALIVDIFMGEQGFDKFPFESVKVVIIKQFLFLVSFEFVVEEF
jgi:hypothetical protein